LTVSANNDIINILKFLLFYIHFVREGEMEIIVAILAIVALAAWGGLNVALGLSFLKSPISMR